MQEGNPPATGAAPGRFIDQPIAGRASPRQRRLEIGDPVADVVDAGPAFRKELRHGARGIARLEQLDVDGTEMQADDGRAVGRLGVARGKTQDVTIEGERVVDAGDGDADMSD